MGILFGHQEDVLKGQSSLVVRQIAKRGFWSSLEIFKQRSDRQLLEML